MTWNSKKYQIDDHLFGTLIDHVESATTIMGGRRNLKHWMELNLSHPLNPGENWSFKDHEYQIGIVEDMHPHVAVEKPAQTGVSQLALGMALGLLSVIPHSNIIYSLQTQSFANKFSSTRFTPAIEKSEKLKALLDRNTDSAQLKRIGNSYLHIVGSHSDSQAISIPASALINDEISFSSPSAIGTLMSRLEHLSEEEKVILQFSTPLYSGMGISEISERGTKYVRMVFHDQCGKWVHFDVTTDFVIPGFDHSLEEWSSSDLDNPRVKVNESYLKCPECGNCITQGNLADPAKRAWVPTYQERVGVIGVPHSYCVSPLDVAAIKYVPQIVRSIGLYKRTDRFYQYGLGKPYDNSEGRINPERLERAFTGPLYSPESGEKLYGSILGSDVGKKSHMAIAKKYGDKLVFVWFEHIVQDGEGRLQNTWVERIKEYGVTKAVVDAAPDFSSCMALQEVTPYEMAWGAYYTRGGQNKAEVYELKESEGMVAISRTRAMNAFVKDFNNGKIVLPKNTEHEREIKKHLMNMHRISEENATGEEVERWVADSPETHFFMVMLYAYIASQMQETTGAVTFPRTGALISKARIRQVRA